MDRGEEAVSTEGGALPVALNPQRPPPGAGSLILLPSAQAAAPPTTSLCPSPTSQLGSDEPHMPHQLSQGSHLPTPGEVT